MKFQIGDRVLILHSNEEGEVIDIINNKMVMVDVRGVKFPAYVDQLDFPYFKRFSEKKLVPGKKEKKYIEDIKKEKQQSPRISDGVWITFLPVMETDEFGDEVVQELKLHLINRTETSYKFVYKLNYFGKTDFELKNEILPFQDFYLHDIPFEDLNDSPTFEFEFALLQPQKNKAGHHDASLRLKPRQLFTKIEEIRLKGEAHFSFRLFENYPDKAIEEKPEVGNFALKGKGFDASRGKHFLEPPRSVVDLHIEKITDDWKGLSNYEIVSMQLRTFEKYYDLAVAHMQPSLTVIHGVGTGKLREEIHEQLKHRKEVKTFVNQYHPAFGYGATEIFFDY